MRRALIIGGGWAGIAALSEMSRHHGSDPGQWTTCRGPRIGGAVNPLAATLVEERPYLGGRARSFTDRHTGDEIDNGQHVMMGCYHGLLSLLENYSTFVRTEDLLDQQSALRVAFADTTGRRSVLDASRLPGRAGIAAGLALLRGLSLRGRLAALRLAALLVQRKASGKGLTCAQFLERYGQPPDVIERFWEPIVLATLNAPLHLASAELLVTVMELAFLGTQSDATMLIPKTGLSTIVDSVSRSQHGFEERIGVGVDRLVIRHGIVERAVLGDGSEMTVDAVISAIPQRALERLLASSGITDHGLPPAPEMSPIISVYLWYDQPWMQDDFTAALGTTVQWVFDKRRIRPGLVALTVSAGSSLVSEPTQVIAQRCDAELRQLFPELRGIGLWHSQVIKEKQATPLYTPHTVRPGATALQLVASNLIIAGDWTDTGLPATIEGAVRSGITAAELVYEVVG